MELFSSLKKMELGNTVVRESTLYSLWVLSSRTLGRNSFFWLWIGRFLLHSFSANFFQISQKEANFLKGQITWLLLSVGDRTEMSRSERLSDTRSLCKHVPTHNPGRQENCSPYLDVYTTESDETYRGDVPSPLPPQSNLPHWQRWRQRGHHSSL